MQNPFFGAFDYFYSPAMQELRLNSAGFIDLVAEQLPRDTTIIPAEAARACFSLMESCLDRGELIKVRGSLPHEVLNLFPYSLMRR